MVKINNKLKNSYNPIFSFFLNNKKLDILTNSFRNYFLIDNKFKFLFLNKNNFFNFFINFYFYSFFISNKIIKFNKFFFNFFSKSKFLQHSSLYNFYNKNIIYFYKNFSKSFTNFNNSFLARRFRNKKKFIYKNKFFKLRKTKEFLNLNFFNNLKFNSPEVKFFKKKVNFLTFYSVLKNVNNIFFYNKKYFNVSNYYYKNYKSSKFDLLTFYKNFSYQNFTQKIKIKKFFFRRNYIFNPYFDKKILNLYFYKNYFKSISLKRLNKFNFLLKLSYVISSLPKHFRFRYSPNSNLNFIFFHKKLFISFSNYISINKNNSKKNNKYNSNSNIFNILKNIMYLQNMFSTNDFLSKNHFFLISNNFFIKNLKILDDFLINDFSIKYYNFSNKFTSKYYNNYYPVFYANIKTYNLFFSKFRSNLNVNYLSYMNFYIISFLEKFFNKNFFLKVSNNYFNKPNNNYGLHYMFDNYKNFQPKYMKNFLIRDFIELI